MVNFFKKFLLHQKFRLGISGGDLAKIYVLACLLSSWKLVELIEETSHFNLNLKNQIGNETALLSHGRKCE